ncbi:MAG TPA: 2OG-Fe(II) oxygenase [Phenylobacterium sp.]|uniref:2OG-Fe(II) oxygenase n=1 Tax=Phenylobacterium sp. TaxID=1871053 RepID=UPI002B463DF3|nr:2OG-Fe(II) oxygenase [Phenylobacterium sp.]HKR87756.1 2OG-Fe(II) oxygenase [Phenylobacterium sp.]
MSLGIQAIDSFLPPAEHAAVWAFLSEGGWSFGAYSKDDGAKYFYKHFAGFRKSGEEYEARGRIEAELAQHPLLRAVWERLKAGPLARHGLGRCYANGMPPGTEGGLHLDSNIPSHLTAIYYPHPAWDADLAGETLFYNATRDEVLAAVYPKPNRMVIFPGTIPHVARPISTRARDMRITLMFKTTGPDG